LDEVDCHQTNWQQSGLWHISAKRSYSPDCAWWYGQETIGDYNTGSTINGNLTSPFIALPSNQLLKLQFATRWEVETIRPQRDVMLVQIHGNDGEWQTLRQLGGEFTASRQVGLAAPLPTAEKWRIETIDLSAYAGQTVRLRFHFDTVDAEKNDFEGWWVDNITIEVNNPPLYLPETGESK
jgi:hypothetical protein